MVLSMIWYDMVEVTHYCSTATVSPHLLGGNVVVGPPFLGATGVAWLAFGGGTGGGGRVGLGRLCRKKVVNNIEVLQCNLCLNETDRADVSGYLGRSGWWGPDGRGGRCPGRGGHLHVSVLRDWGRGCNEAWVTRG